MKKHILLLLFSLLTTVMVAQLSISVVYSNESRCFSSGSFRVRATGGTTPYRFQILSGPGYSSPGGTQFDSTFNSLQSGTYSVQVVDATNATASTTVTVAGSYINPTLFIDSVRAEGCPNTGVVYAKIINGRAPFKYRIKLTSAASYGAYQASPTFTGLGEGIYTVQAEDSCGNVQTITPVTVGIVGGRFKWKEVTGWGAGWDIAWPLIQRNGCSGLGRVAVYYTDWRYPVHYGWKDSSNGDITDYSYGTANTKVATVQGGTPPYTYSLTSSTGYSSSNTTGPFFDNVPLTGILTLRVTDACGRTMLSRMSAAPLPLESRYIPTSNCLTNTAEVITYPYSDGPLTQTRDDSFYINRAWSTGYQDRPTYSTGYYFDTINGSKQRLGMQGTYPITYSVLSGNGGPFTPQTRLYTRENNNVTVLSGGDPTSQYVIRKSDACGLIKIDTVKPAYTSLADQDTLVWSQGCASRLCTNIGLDVMLCTNPYKTRNGVVSYFSLEPYSLEVDSGGIASFGSITQLITKVEGGQTLYLQSGNRYRIKITGKCSGKTYTYRIGPFNWNPIATAKERCAGNTNEITATTSSDNERINLYQGEKSSITPTTVPYRIGCGNCGPATFSNLPPGVYTVSWVSIVGSPNGGGVNSPYYRTCDMSQTVVIKPYQPMTAKVSYSPVCAPSTTGQVIALEVNNGRKPYQYQIKLQSDPVTSYSALQSSNLFTTKPVGTYDVRIWDSCQNTVVVSVTNGPLAPPILNANNPVCQGGDVILNAGTRVIGCQYRWKKAGSPLPQYNNMSELVIPNALVSDGGSYSVDVIDTVGTCGTVTSSVTATVVSNSNVATANLPNSICEGEVLTLTGGNAIAPTFTTGKWDHLGGPNYPSSTALIADNTANITTATNLINSGVAPGTPHIFRWSIDNGTCKTSARDSIYILKHAFVPKNNYKDECEATTSTLKAPIPPAGYIGRWTQISGPACTIVTPNDTVTTVTGLTYASAITTYEFRWTLYNAIDTTKCSDYGSFFLYNYQQPSTPNAGNDTSLCSVTTYNLNGNTLAVGTGTWNVVGGTSGATFPSFLSTVTTRNALVKFNATGTFFFEWKSQNGLCAPKRDTVAITVFLPSDAGFNKYFCYKGTPAGSDTVRLAGTQNVPGITGTWTSAPTNPGTTTFTPNNTSNTALASVSAAGAYKYYWAQTNGVCTSVDSVTHTFNNPVLKPSAGADISGLCASQAPLNGSFVYGSNFGSTVVWSKLAGPSAGFIRSDSIISTLTMSADGFYTVQLEISRLGCPAMMDTVLIQKTGTPPTVLPKRTVSATCANSCNGLLAVSYSPSTTLLTDLEFRRFRIGMTDTSAWISDTVWSGLCTGTYMVQVRYKALPGCQSNLGSSIVLSSTYPAFAVNAGRDTTLCAGSTIQIGMPSVSGYTYTWTPSGGLSSSTVSNPFYSPTSGGTYNLILAGTLNTTTCTYRDTVAIVVEALPVINITSSSTNMCSGQTRALTATPPGGTFAGTGVGGTTFTAPATAGTYAIRYRYTNMSGCTDSAVQNIVVSAPITLSAVTFSPATVCVGSTTSAIASPAGGTWSIVSGPGTINPSTGLLTTSGTSAISVMYSHPGVPGSSCANSVTGSITPVSIPAVSPSASTSTVCNGASTTISANGTGGTGPYTYSWTNAGSGASFSASPSTNTNYSVTLTDNNSCTATGSTTVTVTGSTPLIATAGTARAICNGASTTLGGSPTASGGAGSYTYAWSGGAAAVANPTVSPVATTTYIVTVTSSACTVTSSVVVTVNPKPSVAPSATASTVCFGASSSIASNTTGGTTPYNYSWNTGSTAASFSATPTSTSTYSVTVTDANTCTATGTTNVTVIGASTLIANAGNSITICNGASVTLGGSPTASGGAGSYSYAWSNGATTANPSVSPTSTTTYTVTVTSSSCTATGTVTITVIPKPSVAPSATVTSICNGGSTVISANATGGTTPYTYSWNSGSGSSFIATPTFNTTYSLTITDANNCTATGNASVTVTGSTPLVANAGNAITICNGNVVTLGASPTASGGAGSYSYAWSNGATTANPTVSPSATTTYTVTVTSSSCTVSSSVVITVNAKPSVVPSASPSSICNGFNSTIAANATGGTTPYTYNWNSGSGSSFTASPSSNTTYNLTVTDANNCSATGSVVLTVIGSSPLNAFAGNAQTICNGVTINLGGAPTGTGGAGSYTYSWSHGATTANPSVSPSTTTTYTVTVTSSTCTATSSVIVTVNPKPSTVPTASSASICVGKTDTIKANATGGTGTLNYSWSPTGSGAQFVASPTANTTYTVTVTDANNCTATGNVSVVVNPLPIVTFPSLSPICQGQSTTLSATPTTGGTGVFTISSGPGSIAGTNYSSTLSGSSVLIYTFTDVNSCINSTSQSIVVNPTPIVNAGLNDTICFGDSKSLVGNQISSLSGVVYEWYKQGISTPIPPQGTIVSVNPSSTTNYIFVGTKGICSSSDTMVLAVINRPDLINDMTACQSATEDVMATWPLTNFTSNDNNSAVLRGGLSYSILGAKHGTASISGSNITYTGALNYNGFDTVTIVGYSTECPNLKDTSVFCVNLSAVNDYPVAVNDTTSSIGTTPLLISVLSNDKDVETTNPNLTVSILLNSTNGTTLVNADGTVSYVQSQNNLAGIDSFQYIVCDTAAPAPVRCDTATVYIALHPSLTDTTIPKTVPGTNITLSGISLEPGAKITDAQLLGPKHNSGTATIDPSTGEVIFIPNSTRFIGKDTIVRIICTEVKSLNSTNCDTSVLYIDNSPVNDIVRDSTPMNTSKTFAALTPVIFEGGAYTTTLDSTLSINPDGTVKYTPPAGFIGIDTATIIRCDGLTPPNCDTTMYIVKILPNLTDTLVTNTNMNTPITIGSPIISLPGSSVTITPIDPKYGSATLNPDGTVSYKPDTNFVGLDTVKRVVCVSYSDGTSRCDTITSIVRVLPNISDSSITTTNGTSVIISAPPIVLGLGSSMTTTTSSPSNGTASISSSGVISYTPNPGFVGIDTIIRTICVTYPDGIVKCDTSLVIIKVLPSISDTVTATTSDKPIVVSTNPVLVSGVGVTVSTSLLGPNFGSASTTSKGIITYIPKTGFVGLDTILRIVCVSYPDGSTICDTSSVVVMVTTDVTTTTGSTESGKPFVGGNPIVPGPGTTISVVGSASNGSVVVNPNGTFTYTPKPGFYGKDTVIRVVCVTYVNGTVKCDTILTIIDVTRVLLDIPNFFSPNGDGINDVWNLDGLLSIYPNAKVMIYSRWGNIVWRSTGPYAQSTSTSNVWYGQSEGSTRFLPDGVYYYVIDLEDDFKSTKSGFIELMRK